MKRNRTGGALIALALLALCAAAGPAAHATEVEPGWRLRFSLASMDFNSNITSTGYGIDIGGAASVNAEYRFSRRLGLDLGAFGGGGVDVANHRSWAGWSSDAFDTMSVTGLTAGLDIHLAPDHQVDLYICPMLAMMQFGNLVFATGPQGTITAVDFDQDLAIGASLGLAVPLGAGRHWTFDAHLTHLESTINGGDRGDLRIDENYDVNMVGVGFGYRF